MEQQWFLYILRCGDDTLYTGITTDIDRRFAMHTSSKGAKYTRGRGPLTIVYRECCGSHSDALRREYTVKALPRMEKEKMIQEYQSSLESNSKDK